MEIQIILALAALGCCTGFLAGLLGIGGGANAFPHAASRLCRHSD